MMIFTTVVIVIIAISVIIFFLPFLTSSIIPATIQRIKLIQLDNNAIRPAIINKIPAILGFTN